MRGGGLGQAVVSFTRPGLLGGQVLAHLLGRLVRRGAHLVGGCGPALGLCPLGFGGCGPLLCRSPCGFDLDLSLGRIGHRGHGASQPLGGRRERARHVPHLAQ